MSSVQAQSTLSFKLSQPNKKRGAPDRAPGPVPAPATGPAPSISSTYQKDPRPTSLVVAVPFPLLTHGP